MLTRAAPFLGLDSGGCWPRIAASGLVLALGLFEGLDAFDDVAVDGCAEGELDGSTNERDSSGFDGARGLDEFVHDADGLSRALLKHQGGVREGFLAELAQFVLEHYCPAIAFGLDDNLFYFKDMNGF